MSALKQLEAAGQAVWLDYLKRSFIEKGQLKALVDNDGLSGVTSNPSIFEKAIGEGDEYADAIKTLVLREQPSVSGIYEHLAVADIQAASDVLRTVYDRTNDADGFVSLECSPYLANDTEATIAEAQRLWKAVDRPNLMIKVPGTKAGIPAVSALIGQGINVNITLLFAVPVYEQVVEAYLSGLEALKRDGGDVSKIASVASFFVSRIDTAADKALDQLSDPAAKSLKGKAAIANAKVAYARWQALFSGERWDALAKAGARPQRLLWASTSVKNPDYKDTLYAEALIGRQTVDTLPPKTLDAFREHGQVEPDAIEQGLDEAKATLKGLEQVGVSLQAITDELVEKGVAEFAEAFDKLFASIASQRRGFVGESGQTSVIDPGSDALKTAIDAEMEAWRKDGRVRRLWASDKSLWTGQDEDQWGGWLNIVDEELADIETLRQFAEEVRSQPFTDVVLLGMGGSSLGPEVIAKTFGDQAGWPRFHMLDSTDPAQVKDIDNAIQVDRTLFMVSSKSGSTLEPNIFADYFLARASEACGAQEAASHFVAVTDPGSPLEKRARDGGWRKIFYGKPSIGGRYSVLSKFGMVPAAAMGLDVKKLLTSACSMVRACGSDVPPSENPGVQLGVAIGVAAKQFGRDKVTLIASPGLAALGAWLEQLLAESTGKQGRGLIPVADEPLGPPEVYGDDRFFAYLELEGAADVEQRAGIAALAAAGHPVARLKIKDLWALGQAFFRWEVAVAAAGVVLDIDPFDQPDVEASKDKTRKLTEQYEQSQSLPTEDPVFQNDGVALYADARNAEQLGRHNTLEGYLKTHFGRVGKGDYAALLAYVDRTASHTQALTEMRSFIRDRTEAATCVGFGPRFQHSTGQAYKGGPNSGVFLQITCKDPQDINVPGHHYSFGVVKQAQARGDLEVLEERGRRALRVHLDDVESGLQRLARAVHDALA